MTNNFKSLMILGGLTVLGFGIFRSDIAQVLAGLGMLFFGSLMKTEGDK